jgi:ketose-bisphosphate aldolase
MEATLKDVLESAYKEHRAVAHFNFRTLEDIEVFIEAASELNTPIIIACGPKVFNTLGGKNIVGVYKSLVSCCRIPVVLHFDHATNLEEVWRAIGVGFTSVMIDGSLLPFEENVRLTSTVVRVAKPAGVSVEGELGIVGGKEETLVRTEESLYTDPAEACRFVAETGVDALAVAVGSMHGFYKSTPKLSFERIREINKAVNIPLVLHGGTGIPIEDIKRAISLGIAKVNIGTEFRALIIQTYREFSQQVDDIVDIVSVVKERLKDKAKELLQGINS